ncbi:type II secretion system secretin GspD [Methyloferula stellata]|uniref:type II secretion system secretin GspD n=1 Tax=Methyloferula stellata TaxID=876270 RepID=UPI001FCAC637|nr:type II secretion system secretin GspD [Methyloferula stellata]
MRSIAVVWLRVQSLRKFGVAAIVLGALSGCMSPLNSPFQMAGVGPGDAADSIRNADLVAHYPANTGGQALLTGSPLRPQIFPGTDPKLNVPMRSADDSPAGDVQAGTPGSSGRNDDSGIEVNFDNADIQTVAKSILSDTLGFNVVIDPRIQGNVTIASATPIARKDLFGAFESVMRMSNAAVVREGNLVKIVPLSEAGGSGRITLHSEQGFGVTVVPLRYTSAATIVKMAENFLARPGALRADTTRNLLMVQGTLEERRSAVDLVTSFDVEWLRNQSVGIYPLKSTSPDTMIHELERVFETAEGGQGQGLINFQPIARMNAIMAVTHNRKLLDQATQWVKRLDHSDASGTTIRIYRLEHGNAPKIAKILNDIFVGRGSGATADAAANQVAPGTNAGQSRLDSIGAGSFQSQSNGANQNSSASSQSSSQSGSSITNSSSGRTVTSFDDFTGRDKKDQGGQQDSGSLPRGVFQNVRITADSSNNSIVIYSNLDDYQVIERSLHELDRPQLQVAIEATIAEVTLTDGLQYGVQYYIGSTDLGAGVNNGSISLSASPTSAVLSQVLPGLNVLLGQQAAPKLILSALSSLTSVKVLSAPSLVVTDNQPAYLQVGDSVPISTGSATVLSSSNTIVNTITMQDTGVILKVWPHVHANGVVDLEIEQEVSAVVGGTTSTTTNLNPTISERRVHSTVSVNSGQTVLLGGLMSEEDDKTQTGIPFLRQIQGIGDLFGNTNGSKQRTEIIVFVRPRVIRNGLDAQNVAEDFRAGLSTMHSNATIISGRDVGGPDKPRVVTK